MLGSVAAVASSCGGGSTRLDVSLGRMLSVRRGEVLVRVYGCSVGDQQARVLVAALNKSGTADALDAAERISLAIRGDGTAGRLSPGMRDALLSVLPEDPPSGLAELRKTLVRDHRARTT